MNTRKRGARNRAQTGSAMLIAVVVVVILIGVTAAYLTVSHHRHAAVEQGLREMNSRLAAEAAVSAMVVKLNADGALGILPAPGSPPSVSGVLAFSETGTEQVNRAGDGVDNDQDGQVDEAGETGLYTGAEWSAQAARSATGTGATITARGNFGNYSTVLKIESIAANTAASAKFGLFGDVSLNGVGTSMSDSYKSSLGSYASQATNVDPVTGLPYALSEGNIGSNGPIGLNGTLSVFGNSTAGPGSTTTTTPGVNVQGSLAPNTVPVPLAPVAYAPDPPADSGAISMNGHDALSLPAGSYHYTSLSMVANAVLNITGDVTIYVDGTTTTTGQATINVTATGKLTLITNGDISVAGGGVVNASQIPANLTVQSASTGSVSMGGNAELYTAIYAPQADVTISGTSDLYGAAVGKTIFFNGTIDFHYDEDLGGLNPQPVYTFSVQSWAIQSAAGTKLP